MRLREKGYELERGIKGSNAKHQKVREFKKTTRYYENKVDTINKNLDIAMNEFEEKMKTTKNIPFDKKHVLIEKETFDSMNKVIKETKQAIQFQPKIQELFNEVDTFAKSHQTLEKENQNMKREIKALTARNQNLTQENNNLKSYLKAILEAIKHFFRELLQIGNEKTKEATTSETILIIKTLILMMFMIFQKVQLKKMSYLGILKYQVILKVERNLMMIKTKMIMNYHCNFNFC